MNNFTNPAVQTMNLIRCIGDLVSQSGKPIHQLWATDLQSVIGATSREFVEQLVEELHEMGVIRMVNPVKTNQGTIFFGIIYSHQPSPLLPF